MILVVALVGIGDLLVFLPALEALKKRFPDKPVHVLTFPNGLDQLLRGHAAVDAIITLPFRRYTQSGARTATDKIADLLGSLRLFWSLRGKYETALWPFAYTTTKKRIISFILHAGKNIMHRGAGFLCAAEFGDRDVLLPLAAGSHRFERNFQLLEPLGVGAPAEPRMDIGFTAEEDAWADRWIEDNTPAGDSGPRLGMLVGGNLKFNPYRQWPPARYAALADALHEDDGARAYLFGTPDERAMLEDMAARMSAKPVLVCGLSLRQALAVAVRMDSFIGNDSSLVHVAAMHGAKTLTVVGPSNPYTSMPRGPKARAIRLDLPCSPCWDAEFSKVCPHHACMARFDTAAVLDEFRRPASGPDRVTHVPVDVSNAPEFDDAFRTLRGKYSAPAWEDMRRPAAGAKVPVA